MQVEVSQIQWSNFTLINNPTSLLQNQNPRFHFFPPCPSLQRRHTYQIRLSFSYHRRAPSPHKPSTLGPMAHYGDGVGRDKRCSFSWDLFILLCAAALSPRFLFPLRTAAARESPGQLTGLPHSLMIHRCTRVAVCLYHHTASGFCEAATRRAQDKSNYVHWLTQGLLPPWRILCFCFLLL